MGLEEQWSHNLQRVRAFRQEHGHVTIPFKGETRMLAKWLGRQKNRVDNLKPYQREALEELGVFETKGLAAQLELQWEENYQKLVAFKKEHGHCDVTVADSGFGSWIANQRKRHSSGKLREDRKDKLDAIGFSWILGPKLAGKERGQLKSKKQDARWKDFYKRLVEFKRQHGHCNVPYLHEGDHSLALWVTTQRRMFNQKSWRGKDEIHEDRKKLLDNLGFLWKVKSNSKEKAQDESSEDSS